MNIPDDKTTMKHVDEVLKLLLEAGRTADVKKAASDEEARKAFYREFGMIDEF